MAINTQNIRIDLNPGRVIPVAHIHQNDTNRQLTFELYNNGAAFTPPSGSTVKFAYKSPIVNGQYSVITGSSMVSGAISGNIVTVTLSSAYTKVSGVGLLTMIMTTSGNTLRPVNIKFVCHGSADGDDSVLGASDWPVGLYEYMDDWLAENEPTEIANLKSDLSSTNDIIYDIANTGISLLAPMTKWKKGRISNGVVYNVTYSAVTTDIQQAKTDITVYVESGYKYAYCRYDDATGSNPTQVAATTNSRLIPQGTYYRIAVSRETIDESEDIPLADLVSKLTGTTRVYISMNDHDAVVNHSKMLMSFSEVATVHAYLDGSGREGASENYRTTDYISVKQGDVIRYNLRGATSVRTICFYTTAKIFVSANSVYGTGAASEGVYTVQSDGYVRLSNHINNTTPYAYFDEPIPSLFENAFVLKEKIPDYWGTAINTAISTINANSDSMNPHNIKFAFLTDVHWKSNAQKSPVLLSKLKDSVGIPLLVFGGDVVDSHDSNVSKARNEIEAFYAQLNGFDVLSTLGNHDNNSDHNTDTSKFLSNGALYDVMFRRSETFSNTMHSVHYGYYDNVSQKVRFIQFDTGSAVYHNGTTNVIDSNLINANAEWVGQKIAELDSDWTVVIFTHMFWWAVSAGSVPNIITPIQTAIQTKILDAEHSATIAAIIVGHMHRDYDATISNTANTETVPIIATTTDNYSQNSYGGSSMTIGTDTEQAFDVYQIDMDSKTIKTTRIGAGSDRTFNY